MLRLPGIQDASDIGQIIEDGERQPGRGNYDLIIGDNPNGEGQVVLRLLEGMVVSASAFETVEDPLGRVVYIDQDEQHVIRDGKDMTYEELREAIQNPDEIWRGSEIDFYVKKLDDGTWRIVKVYHGGGMTMEVSTVVKQPTKSQVDDYLEEGWNELLRKIYPH